MQFSVAAFDGLGNVLVDDVRLAVAIDAHKDILVSVGERLQVLVVSGHANLDLK